MKTQGRRSWVTLVLGVALIAIVVVVAVARRPRPAVVGPVVAGDPSGESPVEAGEKVAAPSDPQDVLPVPDPPVAGAPPTTVVAVPEPAPSHTPPLNQRANPVAPPMPPAEPVVPLTVARLALGYVGADADAEQVWLYAINDPAMSAHARSDLIEDLNETGFTDPKNITEDDLPLIVNRLALIEQLAPDAMDQTNADAFAEAYKDLVSMYLKVTAAQ